MERLKTFAKYAIWIILFGILSDILINIGINTTYKDMNRRGQETPAGIEIVDIESTKVNGRVKLKINDESLHGKYIKLVLFSAHGKELGTQYIDIGNANEIESYFKISDVKSYEITVVNEKGVSTEGFMDTAMSALTVLVTVIKLLVL